MKKYMAILPWISSPLFGEVRYTHCERDLHTALVTAAALHLWVLG